MTLILTKKLLPSITTSSLTTVGVRIPDHAVALELIKLSGGLLVGTSANKTGAKPPSTAFEASEQLNDEVDAYLDGGVVELGISSTVVDLIGEKPRILRRGSVSLEEVLDALEECV